MERKQVPVLGRTWLPLLAGLAAYTLLALVYLRPIWRVGGDHIAPVPEDPVFNLWVLKWGAHQIRLGLPHFWDANIFWPTRGTLALSDHLFGPALQLTAFLEVVPNAVAGYNFLFFTSFVASALTTAWVVRQGGRSWLAALLAGWMFAFAPFRLQHFNHIQILIAQWIPLTLWFWDRLLDERRPRHAVLFLLFYLLHVTGGSYLAYMIHFPMLVLLVNRAFVHGRELVAVRSLRLLVPIGLIAAAVLAVFFLPYLETSKRLDLVRDESEIGHFGATFASYLSPAPGNLYWKVPKKRDEAFFRTENALFPGFLPTIFFLWGFGTWLRRYRRGGTRDRKSWVLWGLLLLALAAYAWGDLLTLTRADMRPRLPFGLGAWGWYAPALLLAVSLGLWWVLRRRWRGPLLDVAAMDVWERGLALSGLLCFALTHSIVYVPLAQIVPGLDGMRVPARFFAFVSLTLVWFAARGVDLAMERLRSRPARLALAGLLVLGLAVELAPDEVRWVPMLHEKHFPPVYNWIARHDEVKALVEFPIRLNWRENTYMYYSTLHWKPIANGYSGYEPRSHAALTRQMRAAPDRAGLELLRDMWVTHLVFHLYDLRRSGQLHDLRRFELELATGPDREVDLVYQERWVRVYRIRDDSSSRPKRAGL